MKSAVWSERLVDIQLVLASLDDKIYKLFYSVFCTSIRCYIDKETQCIRAGRYAGITSLPQYKVSLLEILLYPLFRNVST